jgi:protein-L-isoaspartate(D-aspartate) O-methyltransferase
MGAERSLCRAVAALALGLVSCSLSGADPFAHLRRQMVDQQIRGRDVTGRDVLSAMEQVPRHLFVPPQERGQAYQDHPLPIGKGQTISQPYIVAKMTSLLQLDRRSKVLEIGTGSGYHAAVLSRVAGEVYTIEIVESLGKQARDVLARLGYRNVHVRIGDGYQGWPEEGPFDAIVLTAAPTRIPDPLLQQLKRGGRMVLPLGESWQDLLLVTKLADGTLVKKRVLPVRFVPMTGEAQKAPGPP